MSPVHYRPATVSCTTRMKRALLVAGCGVLTVAVSACESTEQESAKIGREGRQLLAGSGRLELGAVNHSVLVSDVTLLASSGRTAVAVRLTGTSFRPQAELPVLVEVTGAGARQLYTNATGGLEASLQQMALLAPHQQAWWVDDQVLTSQSATGVKVRVGTGKVPRTSLPLPTLTTTGVHLGRQSGLSVLGGSLVNHSARAASKVPVYAVALAGGRVVAAGRAVVSAPPRSSSSFQIFLVGNPEGARVELTVAPTPDERA
ncbi:MAG TPA: hypothetical protein VNZ01_07325 [Solirubrobacteraceae bacterium]|jgi:hypothetical protein|nr:hypothetical protein [Solirubrobacteraceae bacterium]